MFRHHLISRLSAAVQGLAVLVDGLIGLLISLASLLFSGNVVVPRLFVCALRLCVYV